jgi:hypothetical protein
MAATDFVTESQVDSLVTNVATAVKANRVAFEAHRDDTSDAHDASAISVADTATQLTATDVEAALAEIMDYAQTKTDDTALTAHIGDTSDAHDASAISIADAGNKFTATEVEAALQEVKTLADAAATASALSAHISDASAAHAASAISIADAAGDYTATDVEAALAEVKLIADAAAGGGVTINDAATNTTQAWSSQKISDYTAAAVAALVDGAPGALDTLNELAAAINDDAAFTTTVMTALGLRVRVDASQSFTSPQQAQGRANIGIVSSTVDFAAAFNTAIA